MRKYDALWAWIQENGTDNFQPVFTEIEQIGGLPIDHSFQTNKKELTAYGYQAGKTITKEQTVVF